jgi:WD40 repeat protein
MKDGFFEKPDEKQLSRQEFRGHSGSINSLNYNQLNDSIFASASNDRSFRVWDTRKSKPMVHTERAKEEVMEAVFSPFGGSEGEAEKSSTYLATSNFNEDEINFYDTRTWKVVKQIKYKTEITTYRWDPSGVGFFVADATGAINVFNG